MFKNTKKQGDWGLGIAIAYFVEQGHTVSLPLTDSQDYDLIVDIDNKLQRIQVKTTTHKAKSGNYRVSFTTKGGNKTCSTIKQLNKKAVEFIFVVTKDKDLYLIPSSVVGQMATLNSSYEIFKK